MNSTWKPSVQEARVAREYPLSWRSRNLGVAREVTLPGGTIRYHETGSGPPIVFVHGYGINANVWRKLVPELASHFRCITPDWPLASHVIPMDRDADLSPHGIATLIIDFIAALELDDVTLWGNDSGGAYSQLATAIRPDLIDRLILNSCETPGSSWPPRGFEMNKWMAVNRPIYRLLWQTLRFRALWRTPSTYGWLAKRPIHRLAMNTYVRPPIHRAEIRHDGRKAISAVSSDYSELAADRLAAGPRPPILLLWAEQDRVFPIRRARQYAERIDAELLTVDDAYTYTAEDAPIETARQATRWIEAH